MAIEPENMCAHYLSGLGTDMATSWDNKYWVDKKCLYAGDSSSVCSTAMAEELVRGA